MSEAEKKIVLERMYCLRVGGHTLALAEVEARQLYDLLHAEFVPIAKPQLVGDLGPASPDVWRAFPPCPRGPGIATNPNGHRIPVVESPAETGPSLQDDIERMVAEIGAQTGIQEVPHDVVPASGTVDAAEQERRGRINWDDHQLEATIDEPESLRELNLRYPLVAGPSNTPEPPAEPEPAPETPAPSNDQQVEPNGQTWRDRLRELWGRYCDLEPSVAMKRLLTAAHGSKHAELKAMSSQELRGALREMGFDMPEPASHAERAAMARAAKLARNRERLEPPKVEAPAPAAEPIESTMAPMPLHGHPLEVSIQLIHILARAGRRRFPDGAPEVAARIGDLGPGNRLGSMPMTEVEEWERAYRKWLDAYSEMPPFKQRDVDASLLAEWKMVAA